MNDVAVLDQLGDDPMGASLRHPHGLGDITQATARVVRNAEEDLSVESVPARPMDASRGDPVVENTETLRSMSVILRRRRGRRRRRDDLSQRGVIPQLAAACPVVPGVASDRRECEFEVASDRVAGADPGARGCRGCLRDGASDNEAFVDGKVTPKKLDKQKFKPVNLFSGSRTETNVTGTQANPAAETLSYGKNIKFHPSRAPVCPRTLSNGTPTETATTWDEAPSSGA